jgi:hypothetical protein
MTAEKVRPWILLFLGAVLIFWALIHDGPALLMVGCSLLGVEPLSQIKKEEPPP